MASPIATFWDWFAENHEQAATASADGDADWLHANLTARVKRIEPRLNWEMGPYYHPDRTLVISPSVRANLGLARRVVAVAPRLPGWRFLPAKPPKRLKRLAMQLPGVEGAEVCADGWTYRLTAYNQGEFFDVEVFTDVTRPMGERDLETLTHHLIEALLGEEVYLERIAAVTVLRPGDAPAGENVTRFPLLGQHLAHLLRQASGK
jgi:hypothetical protein